MLSSSAARAANIVFMTGDYHPATACCGSVTRPDPRARQARNREQAPQQPDQSTLDALTDQARIGQRRLRLEAAWRVVQAPLDEMLAVVGEQLVALLTQPRTRAPDDFGP